MGKTESALLTKTRPARVKHSRLKPRPKALQPKDDPVLDRAETARMIDRMRQEVEFHRGRAAEIKTKLEDLAGTATSELNKVNALSTSIMSLYENGQNGVDAETPAAAGSEPSAGPAGDAKAQWKGPLGREFEKLLATKRLLEAMLPVAAEVKKHPEVTTEPNGAKKILVVDDDPTTVKIISHFLEKERYQVSASLSGVEGLQKALKEAPDLILLDIMIPDLDGFQFLSVFRKCAENPRVPVVIISSLAEETEVLKGLEFGAMDYITKPFSPQILMAKIKKNLNSGP